MAQLDHHYTDGASSEIGPFPVRLLVHAVNDETNASYLKEAAALLREVQDRRLPFETPEQRDITVASLLDRMCFTDLLPVGRGVKAYHGLLHVFPEWRGSMPIAARALTSWERWSTTREGGPASRATIYFIAAKCVEQGYVDEGLAFITAADAYLREQDWLQLRAEDLHFVWHDDKLEAALLLGRRHRGESVKTGQEQGVTIDDPLIALLLWARAKSLASHEKVFHTNETRAGRAWRHVLHEHGLDFVGPMHTLRHSGPSEDVMMKKRSLTDVQRRGRWSQAKSVQRYAKPHALVVHESKVPEAVRKQGEQYRRSFLPILQRIPAGHRWHAAVRLVFKKQGEPLTER